MGGDFAFAGDMMNNFSNFNQQPMMPNMMMNNNQQQQQMMMPNMMMNNQQQQPMMPNMMMNNQQQPMMMPNMMMNNNQQQPMMMPNMMMNNQQPSMMQNNNTNNLSATSMNENEFKSKLNSIMADRNSVMNLNKGPPKKFNPMISPHQNNNNFNSNGNFSKGGRVGDLHINNNNGDKSVIPDFANMSTEDIQDYIISTKKEIANSFGVDLKKIQNMTSKEINNLINNIKNPKQNTELQESKNENKQKKKKDSKNKEKLINLITNIKKEEINIYDIKSEEISKPEYYNDYLFEMPKIIKNISNIELLNFDIPNPLTPINQDNNQLLIIINQEEKFIELDSGIYTIDELIEGIQSAFDQEDMKINISENNGYIQFKSNDTFTIDNTKNSLAKIFGFNKSIYKNDTEYTSETKHHLVSKLYIYIDTIDKNNFMFMIDFADKNKSILNKKFKTVDELSDLIIKFKRSITEDDDLYDFDNKPHILKIKIN
jgi:hypothetical protein